VFDDLDLWKQYKKTGDKDILGKLVMYHKPSIDKMIYRSYSRANVPQETIRAKGMGLIVDAINTYDPNKGAALGTHVYNYGKKLHRFVDQQKQVVRISESQSGKAAPYMEAVKQLESRLGREPSALELADELGWSIKDVNKMKREITVESPMTSWDGFGAITTSTHEDDVVDNVYKFDLLPEEKLIFEYSTGYGGADLLPASTIAAKLNILPSQVSQKKKNIAKKISFRQNQLSLHKLGRR